MNARKPADPEIQRAAAAIQLSVAMAQTFKPAELGNDMYELMYQTWIRAGCSAEWITQATDAHDQVERIAFIRKRDGRWVLSVEWRE